MRAFMIEKGLSLVEVLAAIAILGIAFVGIMTIFPQMSAFNAKTETKLDTMNLARQEMAKITFGLKWEKIIEPSSPDPTSLEPEFLNKGKIDYELTALSYSKQTAESLENMPYTADSFIRYRKDGDYRYVTDIYLQCEAFMVIETVASGAGATVECAKEDRLKLHKVHLKVYSNKGNQDGSYRLSSETYSYIRFTAKKPPIATGGG